MNKKALGKGLGALIPQSDTLDDKSILELKITEIEPNDNQPRRQFDDEALNALAQSIIEHGVVQPIIVTKHNDTYKIVAGERRWRAARIAGQKTIPAIVKEYTDQQIIEVALIENLQRQDLNPIEEAYAYKSLIDEYKLTQEEIAKRISKSRPAIANSLRLISLPDIIKDYVSSGKLTAGHARALISIEDKNIQKELADRIISENLNVRQIEKLVNDINNKKNDISKKMQNIKEPIMIDIEDRLKSIFGTKVTINKKKKGGKIEIEYFNNEDFDRILEIMEKKGLE